MPERKPTWLEEALDSVADFDINDPANWPDMNPDNFEWPDMSLENFDWSGCDLWGENGEA